MPMIKYKYAVIRVYDSIGYANTVKDAQTICENYLNDVNVPYQLLKKIKTSLPRGIDEQVPVWIFVYQYRTYYFETFLIVPQDTDGQLKLFGTL